MSIENMRDFNLVDEAIAEEIDLKLRHCKNKDECFMQIALLVEQRLREFGLPKTGKMIAKAIQKLS